MMRDGTGRSGLPLALAVAAIAFVIYLPSLRNGLTNWDDWNLVTENPRIQHFHGENVRAVWTGLYAGNYFPLTLTSYALDHAIGGLDPFVYHLQNVLWHAGAAAVFALILVQLGAGAAAAGIAACVFAIHPAQVESVSWVAERSVVLSGFFVLASFLVYVRATRGSPPSAGGIALSLALYAGALLSKVTVILFPGILLLYDLGYRRERPARLLLEKAPFVAAGLAATLVGYRGQVEVGVPAERWLGGSPAGHVATMADLMARYARLLLFPTGLSAIHDPPEARSLLELRALAGLALAGLAVWIAWRAWRGSAAARRALVWVGFFGLGILPMSQIVPYSIHMAERYLYVPLIGVAAGAGIGGAALARSLEGRVARAACAAALGIALASFALLTLARERVWRDSMTLWSVTVTRPPVHWSSWYNYGRTLSDEGRLEEAISSYERALERRPDEIKVLGNLGNALARAGELGRAEAVLRRAATLPQGGLAYRAQSADNLGLVLRMRDRYAAALSAFQDAARLAPRDPSPRVHLGETLGALGRTPEARMRFEQALALDRDNVEASIGLAGLDLDAGKGTAARARLDALVARNPGRPDVLLERARVLAAGGNTAAARADLDRALDLAPPGALRRRIQEARAKLAPGEGR